MYDLLWKAKILSAVVIAVIESTVSIRRHTSLDIDWDVTDITRHVSTALCNVKYDLLLSVSNIAATSAAATEIRNNREKVETSEIHEDLNLLAPTQSLQDTHHTEAHWRFWEKKEVYLKLNSATVDQSWRKIGLLGNTLTAGHSSYELNT